MINLKLYFLHEGNSQNSLSHNSQGGLKVTQKDEDDTGIENTGSSETNSSDTDTLTDGNSSTSLPDSIEGTDHTYKGNKGDIIRLLDALLKELFLLE